MQLRLNSLVSRSRAITLIASALLAIPALPAIALATPIVNEGSLEPAAPTAVGTPTKLAADGIGLTASEPQYDYQVYYLDGFGNTWYNNGEVARYMYVRTNNPSADFDISFSQSKMEYSYALQPGSFDDVEDQGQSYNCLRVPGGYVVGCSIETDATGPQTLELYELTRTDSGHVTNRTLAATFTVNFVDYNQVLDNWIDDTIDRYTNPGMNPLDQMQSISDGLREEFDYLLNDDWHLLNLVTQQPVPFFESMHWQSMTSPAVLCLIAERIGGFSDVHNCYYDTENWDNMHFWCRVTYEGEQHYYMACPDVETGQLDRESIETVDFSNTSSPVFAAVLDYKEVGSRDDQTAEHAISTVSPNGSVYVAGGNTAAAGETVAVTLTPGKDQSIAWLIIKLPDGSEVSPTSDGANRWTFVMPESDVTVFAKFTNADSSCDCDGGSSCPTHSFIDVDAGAWYHEAVDWAVEGGTMKGYSGAPVPTFGPEDTLNRAQVATILYNLAGNPDVDSSLVAQFSDCSAGEWYAEAVAWSVFTGAFSGYEGTDKFGPTDSISREQMAVVLWRRAGEPMGTGKLADFPDGSSVSPWAREAMKWAVGEGLITGYSDTGMLAPGSDLTRAQAAAIVMRWTK